MQRGWAARKPSRCWMAGTSIQLLLDRRTEAGVSWRAWTASRAGHLTNPARRDEARVQIAGESEWGRKQGLFLEKPSSRSALRDLFRANPGRFRIRRGRDECGQSSAR